MFTPDHVFYEKNVEFYPLGKVLLDKYKNIPSTIIENHNNIEELREKENKDFPLLKRHLILGIRKTHKYTENHKVSDYLVPYTSSRLYCYVHVLLFSLQL